MTDGGDGAKDGGVDQAADTPAESSTENRSEVLAKVISFGLAICQGVFDVGAALPVVGSACGVARDACGVARDILEKIRTYKGKADDVLAFARFVVRLVKIIEKYQEEATKLDEKNRKLVEEMIVEVYGLLKDMKKRADAFVDRGFIVRFLIVDGEGERISKLEEKCRKAMEDVRGIFLLEMFGDVKAIRAVIESALIQLVSASPDSTTTGGDLSLLLQVFEVVMRVYESEDEEKAGVNELCRILHGHESSIDKKMTAAPQFFGLGIKTPCTPLHVACALGKYHLAICLAAQGFDVNGEDAARRLPVHYAARHGHLDVVEWIIKLHRRKRFHEGTTTKSLQELLQAEGKDGLNARDIAILAEQEDVEKILTAHMKELGLSETVNARPTDKLSSALVKERK